MNCYNDQNTGHDKDCKEISGANHSHKNDKKDYHDNNENSNENVNDQHEYDCYNRNINDTHKSCYNDRHAGHNEDHKKYLVQIILIISNNYWKEHHNKDENTSDQLFDQYKYDHYCQNINL